MELQSDHGLLVVNLDNCLSSTAAEQVVKGDCVYTVAVASDICTNEDEAVMHIPLSVHCSGEVQQTFAAVTQLSAAQQHYSEKINANEHYEQIEFKEPSHLADQQTDHLNQQNGVAYDNQNVQHSTIVPESFNEAQDADGSYYSEICNYLTSETFPQGATESYKKVLRKRAQNYKIVDGELYYGHKQPKRVVIEKAQQLEILRNVHIKEETGIHLGLKKMYFAITRNYFWRGLYVDVANFVRKCNSCSENIDVKNVDRDGSSKECGTVYENCESENNPIDNILIADPKKVWQEVEVRIYGPYPRTERQNEFILGIIDPCSHWITAYAIPGSDLGTHVADTICKTFCIFGFANCKLVNVEHSDLEAAQFKYDEHVMSLQDTLLNSGSSLLRNLISLKEEESQCNWAIRMFDEFVSSNALTWDAQLDKFVFESCIKTNNDSSSPFIRMFGRGPVSLLEENKENNCSEILQQKGSLELPKRRRLQSSLLQCRHCEEIFTSKISFRIHQRKHTEEARRQGTLEGEEPLQHITEREKGMLRRATMKRKQRFMRQGSIGHKERLAAVANRLKPQSNTSNLPKDRERAELQAHTVAAVRRFLAATKEARRRRGRYQKYSAELQEEMAQYALEHGNLKAVHYFSKKMGTTVSESTIRNIVKLYRSYTPKLKLEIGKYALEFGVEAACSHFSGRLGQEVRRGLIQKFKKMYTSQHQNGELEMHGENQDKSLHNHVRNTKQKELYSQQLKRQQTVYSAQSKDLEANHYFPQKLSSQHKKTAPRKPRKACSGKQATQMTAMQQLPSALVTQQEINANSAQTIDILHAPVNILNSNVNNAAAVLYNTSFQTLPHINSSQLTAQGTPSMPLTYGSIAQCNSVTSMPFTQHQETATSVIMDQNNVNFHQSSLPVQTFQESRSLYSNFSNEAQPEKGMIPSSERIVPLSLNHRDHQTSTQPAHNAITPQVPTFTVAIAPSQTQHCYSEVLLPPHQRPSLEQSGLETQLPLLSTAGQSGSTPVHHLVAMPQVQQQPSTIHSSSHPSSEHGISAPCNQQTLLQTHGPVMVQQPSVLANPLMLESAHTQVIEPQALNSSTALTNAPSNASFESSSSTFIGRQNSIFSVTNDINSEVSVTIEKDNAINNQPAPIHVTEEAPRNEGEVVISIIPQEGLDRMENFNENLATCSNANVSEQTKVIHVVKVDCSRDEDSRSLEEDVDDPAPLRKHSVKRKKSDARARKINSGSHRRGNYTVYSPEIRAEMGKYAAEHGSQQACKYFKSVLGHAVAESTIRGLRDKYLMKREHNGSEEGEVTSLGYAPRGRPMRLGKYDEVVQECIRELIKSGERVSSFLAITTAKQVLMQYEPGLLEENGGNVKLNVTWAKSFLKRIGAHNN